MAIEYAKNTHKGPRSIEDVPEFRQHLRRNGLRNLAEFEARQKTSPDTSQDELLILQRRYARAKERARR
jgi:hypothetical protein